jgi:hypothetical protein
MRIAALIFSICLTDLLAMGSAAACYGRLCTQQLGVTGHSWGPSTDDYSFQNNCGDKVTAIVKTRGSGSSTELDLNPGQTKHVNCSRPCSVSLVKEICQNAATPQRNSSPQRQSGSSGGGVVQGGQPTNSPHGGSGTSSRSANLADLQKCFKAQAVCWAPCRVLLFSNPVGPYRTCYAACDAEEEACFHRVAGCKEC